MKRYIDANDDMGLSPVPPEYATKLKNRNRENKKSKKRAVQYDRKTKTN